LVPAFHTQKRRDKATEVKRERIKKKKNTMTVAKESSIRISKAK
jgi:hypothetical protein